ncbi:Phospholipid methyltransferase [uncultured archaeon]|nr:Phospholipid methyltransferase [uncultured archaeon]
MNLVGIIVLLCWITLLSYWAVGAFFQKSVEKKSSYVSKLVHSFFMILPLVLLLGYNLYHPLSIVLVEQSLAVDLISIFLCVFGLIIDIWARTTLAGNWSAQVVLKKKHELVQNGPYRFVRHPIYSGYLLLFLGTTLAIGRVGGFIGLVTLFIGFWIKLREEERLMTKTFGKGYLDYKKRTKALIPYVL